MNNSGNVLITGGSGLVGRRLTEILESEGYQVGWLSRRSQSGRRRIFQWDIDKGLFDLSALDWAGNIVHLAGEGIAEKSWTASRKQEILESRVKPASLLAEKMKERGGFEGRIVCASAVGYYGAILSDHVFTEVDEGGSDFMSEVCREWENSSSKLIGMSSAGGAILRIGIVLSSMGGALPKLAAPVRFFAGARLGSGKQMIPWIHIDDLCRMFIHCLKNSNCNGIYNAVAPSSCSHDRFMKSIGQVMGRPVFLPHVPEFVLSAALGEMSVMVSRGVAVSAEKMAKTGFKFLYPELEMALKQELR